ncbi:MAG: TIGR04283 family arsenosugar biosynthesis glycosyltransferase [Verrucomicrobia bacterium]|nr:TIGR04283 family arsenosugar biosynthesis glycosyltransferase [Verrucomicrobiota bacterium]
MISIVIPTLNEAERLPLTLKCIRANTVAHEIIVADGGSTDATLQVAMDRGAKVVCSDKGRARQMNAGAEVALGNILLFLHADTQIHPSSLTRIEEVVKDRRVVGGGFARKFDSDSMFLRCSCAVATLRCSIFGWFLGDQGIFVRREVFERLGGFREMTAFEDVDFSRRLAGRGKTATLRPAVLSSARRFSQRGPFLTTCRDIWMTCQYLGGKNYSAK